MRVAIFDQIEPTGLSELPCRLVQDGSRAQAATLLFLYLPAVVGLAVAPLVIFLHAVLTPGAQAVLTERPLLVAELIVGFVFWLFLLGLPLKRLVGRLATHRIIEIDGRTVSVTDHGNLRTSTWDAPLASYAGLTHHVRASLSGTRHELILVHRNRKKSILLRLADHISQSEVDRLATLLGCEEIPARELYRIRAFLPDWPIPGWWRPAHA